MIGVIFRLDPIHDLEKNLPEMIQIVQKKFGKSPDVMFVKSLETKPGKILPDMLLGLKILEFPYIFNPNEYWITFQEEP